MTREKTEQNRFQPFYRRTKAPTLGGVDLSLPPREVLHVPASIGVSQHASKTLMKAGFPAWIILMTISAAKGFQNGALGGLGINPRR